VKTALPLGTLYERLLDRYGPQRWWPGDSPLEIAVGAILTQNTNWSNVEKAIANLKQAGLLDARRLQESDGEGLAETIRPSGFYRVKARRLKAFIDFLAGRYGGSMERMGREDEQVLRERLLAIHGIGEETADSILLYALGKPVFVIDAYTRRVLSRHGMAGERDPYTDLQTLFHREMERDTAIYNEFHALFVRVGKECCRPRRLCESCPLKEVEKCRRVYEL
jgi:endonuclease-3 related protein